MKCVVDGCDRPRRYKKSGLCNVHDLRQRRHGDVHHRNCAANGELIDFILNVAVPYHGDDCLQWPYGTTDGYGELRFEGTTQQAHRVVCILAHGRPPPDKPQACHDCGRGQDGCVNPKHLRWDTAKGNADDQLKHGTRRRGEHCGSSKLTEVQVLKIRSLNGTFSQREIAEQFGVNRSTISRFINRVDWSWL